MPVIIRSAQSEQDVWEIAARTAYDNPLAAERMIDRFDKALKMLAQHPLAGRSREDCAPNLRGFPIRSYILFYRPISDGIELARVLHGAQELRRIFSGHTP